MSARAILLRVLLCVSLVFNGAASAMASVGMMQMHAQAADADMADASMPCHDAAEAQPGHATMASSTAPDTGHPAGPDCCESSACTCACVGHVIAMIPTLTLPRIVITDPGSIRPMLLGYPAPALPNLIRPPIG